MKSYLFLFFLALFSLPVFSQSANCPPNIDFETGTLDNWQCSIGTVEAVNGVNTFLLAPSAPTAGRHEIIDFNTAGFDQFGEFPEACPYGGRYSVKLGNTSGGHEAEGISYTFQIPPLADTFSLTYYYAVVFEDPDHQYEEQPRFFVSAYDVESGRVIDCASYDYVSNGSLPGFKRSRINSTVLYKEWTPSSIDFAGYAGKTVRLEFKTADCVFIQHFGYAYLDVGTGCGGVMALGAHCIGTDSVMLTAPYGFESYTWYNANYSTVIGTSRLVAMYPAPSVSTMFHVDMVPYPGFGCRDTADAEVTILPLPDTPSTKDVFYCRGEYAYQLRAQPAPGHELLWYRTAIGGAGSTSAPIPLTATSGVFDFWVSQRSLFGGCEGPRKKMTVTVSPTPAVSFIINDNRQCQVGNNFVFTGTASDVVPGAVFKWDFGDGSTSLQYNSSHIYTTPGYYNISLTVTNPPGCPASISHPVSVIDKPIAAFSYPAVICENQTPVIFQNNSYVPGGLSTINSYWWKVGNTVSTTITPVSFTTGGGNLPVKLVVHTADGCRSDTTSDLLNIHYSPIPSFSYGKDLCNNEVIQFKDLSYLPSGGSGDQVVKWQWWYNNVPSSVVQHPATILPAGLYHVKLQAESDKGCKWRSADSAFTVYPKPSIALHISDSCVFRDIVYSASITSPVAVSKWWWDFGYGLNEGNAGFTRRFTREDYHPVTLIGQTIHHCKDTIIRPFTIYYNRSKAERDTVAAKDEPVQLLTSKAVNMLWYKWTPSTSLSSSSVQDPVATYDLDQVYELNTLTVQGCDSYSKILVRRFKGPELYVANAFTPNNDSRNDVLHIFPVGIRAFNYFRIYNRRGQLVFETNNYYVGWDGTFKGVTVDPENYVWMAMATDYKGTPLFRRGNVLVLR